MSKKYKMKKRKKIVNPYFIFLALAASLIFVSSGYALLSDNLKINGTVTFAQAYDPEYEFGESTYNPILVSTWPNGNTGGTRYQVKLEVTNRDEDIEIWEVSFDIPDGYLSTSDIWQAETVSHSGNTLTLKGFSWNGALASGSSLTLNFILDFETEVDFYIKNLVLNGKYANMKE